MYEFEDIQDDGVLLLSVAQTALVRDRGMSVAVLGQAKASSNPLLCP